MYFIYLRRELRRRKKQAVAIALGLAIGIGLVVTVSAASAGVRVAQGKVLHSLYGVGTDMTVSKTAAAGSAGAGQHFGFGGGTGAPGKRPTGSGASARTQLSRDMLHASPGSGTLAQSDVSKVASLSGTRTALGALELTDTAFSGSIPSASSSGSSSAGAGGPPSSSGTSSSNGSSSFKVNSFTVDGVQISTSDVGPLTSSQVTKGAYFGATDTTSDVAILSSSYAKSKDLTVGSKITVGAKKLKVIGIADTSSSSADVYTPLGTAQKLSGMSGKVTTIFVAASSASGVSALATEVRGAVPGATVSTSSSLANDVSGSLSSASSLATDLGRWISIAALVVAFIVSGLLMMTAVTRRVREFGTLKAIGWRTRRVVGQVMGEGLVIGIAGGVLGLILGVIGAEVISLISPSLSASVGSTGGAGAGPFGGVGRAAMSASKVLVHLSAPLQAGTIALAVALAIAGGLISGAFGAWRAARLRPAAALRTVA